MPIAAGPSLRRLGDADASAASESLCQGERGPFRGRALEPRARRPTLGAEAAGRAAGLVGAPVNAAGAWSLQDARSELDLRATPPPCARDLAYGPSLCLGFA